MAQECHTSSLETASSPTEEQPPPAGFTFTPTDEKLIVRYLRNYAAGRSIQYDGVVEAEVYSTEPWSLLGVDRDIGYFLTKRTRHGKRVQRTAGGGTWMGQARRQDVVSAGGEVIGFKSMFTFCMGGDGGCSKKPPKKTTGYVMYEYDLPTADEGARQQGASQEPVLCCVKKSAREIARSHKRKLAEAAQAPAAETSTAAYAHDGNKRACHPAQISEAGLEHDSSNGITSCILAAPESATPEFADAATFTDEDLALAGIPWRLLAADRSSAPQLCLSAAASQEGDAADAVNLISSDGLLGKTMPVDQQLPIPYHGNADFFEVGECSYNSTVPEYFDSVTSADVATPSSTYAADYSTLLLPMMASSEREMTTNDVNLAFHSAFGMTTDVNRQPIPYHGEWTAMMNTDVFYGLGRDVAIVGNIVGFRDAEGAGDCQLPPLPYELTGMTMAAATGDQQLLLPPDPDKQSSANEAGSLDQLLSELNKARFYDWYDSLFNAEPSLPPLVDPGMPFRDCRMPPPALLDATASSSMIAGNEHAEVATSFMSFSC